MLCEAPQSNKNISKISSNFRLISTRTVNISHLGVHDVWRFSQAFLKTTLLKLDFFSALSLGPHWCYQTLPKILHSTQVPVTQPSLTSF